MVAALATATGSDGGSNGAVVSQRFFIFTGILELSKCTVFCNGLFSLVKFTST